MLMAADIEVPRQVGIHGFLLLGEHKMSKSLGNVIDPFQVVDLYGPDALRFYVLREVSFGSGRRGLAGGLRDAATPPSSPTSTATSRAARSR